MRRVACCCLVFLTALGLATVVAQIGSPGAVPALAAPALQPAPGQFTPVPSTRVVDQVAVAAGATVQLQLAGAGPVPVDASAVALDVTVVAADSGALSLYPAGSAPPGAAEVAYRGAATTRVGTVTALGPDGRLVIGNGGPAAVTVTVDVQGFTAPAGARAGSVYVPLTPTRLVSNAAVAANATYAFAVVGTGGVRATDVSAVALTVTVDAPGAGRATLYPTGATNPGTPQVEYVAGGLASNAVVVSPGANGTVTLFNASGAARVYVEVTGYFTTAPVVGSALVAVPPGRVDTVTVGPRSYVSVGVPGRAGVPASGVSGACLRLTTTGPATASSYLIALPYDPFLAPAIYTARYYANVTTTGAVIAKVPSDGGVRLYNGGAEAVRVAVDATCYLRAATPPGAPTGVSASSADGAADVSWRAPPDGGAPITEYVVTSVPEGRTATVAGDLTTARVTGLTNGAWYRFTVRAKNGVGVSAPSASSPKVVPSPPVAPGTALVTAVYPRDGAVRVSWSPPDTGAASVTGYEVSAEPGGAVKPVPADRTETVIGGLTNGTAYRFTVRARNATGDGPLSLPSEWVVPSPADPPLPPAGLLTVPLDRRIDVQWVAPADGGSPITGYRVTAEPGGHRVDVAADTTVAALTGLTNGQAYTVRVAAVNGAGAGEPAERGDLVPAAHRAPQAPTDVRASVLSDGAVSVSWRPPVDTGTAAISNYRVSAEPGGATTTVTGTTATLTGLDPATPYRFTVGASSAAGAGPASPPTAPLVPALTVKKTPKVLTADEAATLRQVRSDGTLLFEQPPPAVAGLAPGTILVLRAHRLAPSGLFRRVTGVGSQAGLVAVSTAPAALTEVFDKADLAAVSQIGDDEVAGFSADSPAIRRRQPTLHGRTLDQGARAAKAPGAEIGLRGGHVIVELSVSMNNEQPDNPLRKPSKVPPVGGRLEAWLDLDPHLDNQIHIGEDGVDTYHQLSVTYVTQLRAKVGFLRAERFELPRLRIRTRCFNIQAGPLPVVICLEFTVRPTIAIDGSLGLSAGVTFGRIIGGEMTTHDGAVTSHRGINESTGTSTSDISPYADTNITFGLPFESTVYFYDVAGPGFVIQPYLQLKIDTTQNPWWEVRAGITLGLFFRVRDLFGHQIEFLKDDVVNVWYSIARSDGPFAGLRVTPSEVDTDVGVPFTFQATQVPVPLGEPVHWRMVSGPGQIDADTGVFRSDLAGDAVVEAYLPGNAGTGGKEITQRAIARVKGFSVPSRPLAVVAKARPLAAQVSWARPETDGHLGIIQYAVVSYPATRTVYVPGSQTSVKVGSLTPGTAYTFQVFAINDRGSSAASSPSEVVRPYEALRPVGEVVNIATDAEGNPDSAERVGGSGVYLSGDGRYAFFRVTQNSNLAPPEVYDPDLIGEYLVRKNLLTGEIELASRGVDGRTPVRAHALAEGQVSPSFNGDVVAFHGAEGIVDGSGLIVHDLRQHTSVNMSVVAREVAPPFLGDYHLSDDGSRIAFTGRGNIGQTEGYYSGPVGQVPDRTDPCLLDPACLGSKLVSVSGDGRTAVILEQGHWYGVGNRVSDYHTLSYSFPTGAVTRLSTNTYSNVDGESLFDLRASADGSLIAGGYWGPGGTGMFVKRAPFASNFGPGDLLVSGWPVRAAGITEGGNALAYITGDGVNYADRAFVLDLAEGDTVELNIGLAPWIFQFTLSATGNVAAWTYARKANGRATAINAIWVQFFG